MDLIGFGEDSLLDPRIGVVEADVIKAAKLSTSKRRCTNIVKPLSDGLFCYAA